MSVLDERTGCVIDIWKAHDGAITRLMSLDKMHVLSCSVDKTAAIWNVTNSPATLIKRVRLSEGIESVDLYKHNAFLATGGKLAIWNTQDPEGTTSCNVAHIQGEKTKIQGIRTVNVLSLYHLLLVGCEDGVVRAVT